MSSYSWIMGLSHLCKRVSYHKLFFLSTKRWFDVLSIFERRLLKVGKVLRSRVQELVSTVRQSSSDGVTNTTPFPKMP